jgi:hypothetical protein
VNTRGSTRESRPYPCRSHRDLTANEGIASACGAMLCAEIPSPTSSSPRSGRSSFRSQKSFCRGAKHIACASEIWHLVGLACPASRRQDRSSVGNPRLLALVNRRCRQTSGLPELSPPRCACSRLRPGEEPHERRERHHSLLLGRVLALQGVECEVEGNRTTSR